MGPPGLKRSGSTYSFDYSGGEPAPFTLTRWPSKIGLRRADTAPFVFPGSISPGAIVALFGSALGPSQGVGFQLVNGQVPTSLGGTQVLVNGEPTPILYSVSGQLNVILPYSLALSTQPTIQNCEMTTLWTAELLATPHYPGIQMLSAVTNSAPLGNGKGVPDLVKNVWPL